MQKFDYRAPRFVADFPVRLKMPNSSHLARCRDISEDGMRVELPTPFTPDTCGEVVFIYQGLSFKLQVRVAHTGTAYAGLRFVFQSEEQRTDVLHIMSLLATPPRTVGLFLVGQELR
jgi:hypothetical protein